MIKLALRGVRYNSGRYIATLVAIITGVAFFTAAGFLSDRVIDALVDSYRSFRQAAHRLSLEERPPLVPEEPFAVRRRRVSEVWQAVIVAGADPPPL